MERYAAPNGGHVGRVPTVNTRSEWLAERVDHDADSTWRGQPEVEAAGGVVVRAAQGTGDDANDPPPRENLKVVVVHRPHHDDWSLPKGKLEQGEEWIVAALREVEEETGLKCEPREELVPTRYFDAKNRRKLVRWWLMRVLSGEFQANNEVDELRWLALDEAMSMLDYEHDRELIRSLGAA